MYIVQSKNNDELRQNIDDIIETGDIISVEIEPYYPFCHQRYYIALQRIYVDTWRCIRNGKVVILKMLQHTIYENGTVAWFERITLYKSKEFK